MYLDLCEPLQYLHQPLLRKASIIHDIVVSHIQVQMYTYICTVPNEASRTVGSGYMYSNTYMYVHVHVHVTHHVLQLYMNSFVVHVRNRAV